MASSGVNLNIRLYQLEDSVGDLSPKFVGDGTGVMLSQIDAVLDAMISEAERFENSVCDFFGVSNIEALKAKLKGLHNVYSNFSGLNWNKLSTTIQTDLTRYKDATQAAVYEKLDTYARAVLNDTKTEIVNDTQLASAVLDRIRSQLASSGSQPGRLGKGKGGGLASGFWLTWDANANGGKGAITDYHLTKRMAEILSKNAASNAQKSGAKKVDVEFTSFTSDYFTAVLEPVYQENQITDQKILTAKEIKQLYDNDIGKFKASPAFAQMKNSIFNFISSNLNIQSSAYSNKIAQHLDASISNILDADPFAFFEPGNNFNKISGVLGETIALAQFYEIFGSSPAPNPNAFINWIGGTKLQGREPGADLALGFTEQQLGIQVKNTTKNYKDKNFSIGFGNDFKFSKVQDIIYQMTGYDLPFTEQDLMQLYTNAIFNVPFHFEGGHAAEGYNTKDPRATDAKQQQMPLRKCQCRRSV